MSEFIKLSLDDLKEFNLGFRDKYVYNAICVLKENPFYLEEVDMLDTEDAIKKLMEIKGIGLKVASCILMFMLDLILFQLIRGLKSMLNQI